VVGGLETDDDTSVDGAGVDAELGAGVEVVAREVGVLSVVLVPVFVPVPVPVADPDDRSVLAGPTDKLSLTATCLNTRAPPHDAEAIEEDAAKVARTHVRALK
jgi:hypothetical protein